MRPSPFLKCWANLIEFIKVTNQQGARKYSLELKLAIADRARAGRGRQIT
jgi:hypothetical protein